MLKTYFKKIFDVNKTEDAREESYYSVLESLLNDDAESIRIFYLKFGSIKLGVIRFVING